MLKLLVYIVIFICVILHAFLFILRVYIYMGIKAVIPVLL